MNETEKYHKKIENYISILNNKNNAYVKSSKCPIFNRRCREIILKRHAKLEET